MKGWAAQVKLNQSHEHPIAPIKYIRELQKVNKKKTTDSEQESE